MAAIEPNEQATPLNQLPNQGGQPENNDSEFVNNILNEMNNSNNESEQNYNQTQQAYQNQQFAVDPNEIEQQNQQQMMDQQQQQMMMQQQMMQNGMPEMQEEPEKKSMTSKIIEQLKSPLIFLAVFVLLSLPFVRKQLLNQIGKLTQNASLQLWGTTITLGLVGAIIFYVANRYI